jgi:hypothetical protein
MSNEEFLSIGFVEYPHKVLNGNMRYDLGRYRALTIQNLGNPNEMIFIYEVDSDNETEITDLVCLHNYDFDGYLTLEKVKMLITAITGRVF